FEKLALIDCLCVRIHALLRVFGVDTLCPTISQLFMDGSACEFQPRLIEISVEFIRAGHPNHHGSSIGNQPEALLTLSKRFFRPLTVGQVNKTDQSGVS